MGKVKWEKREKGKETITLEKRKRGKGKGIYVKEGMEEGRGKMFSNWRDRK